MASVTALRPDSPRRPVQGGAADPTAIARNNQPPPHSRRADSPLPPGVEQRAPRYTSFPTADRFIDSFSSVDYARHLQARAESPGQPLSVYLHIPFCQSLCYFCGCNKKITRDQRHADPYLERLLREIEIVGRYMGSDRRVSQMHWGGGSPTFLTDEQISELIARLRDHFFLEAGGEYSIEVDPRSTTPGTLKLLGELGFNRLSLGVQDFSLPVQQAVNRVQTPALVQEMTDAARASGFESVNFDLIYGLPLQTRRSFADTVERVIAMRPDRIAMYQYAHLPARFAAQRRILDSDLPTMPERVAIFDDAAALLEQAGYVYIGMDHFALPGDELAQALARGELHRNFQGYATQPDCDLLAFGASAISRVGTCYSQNVRTVRQYNDTIDRGELPVCRGIELSADDLLRRELITGLMCAGSVDIPAFEAAHHLDFAQYFSVELGRLATYQNNGLVTVDPARIDITPLGRRQALRSVCSEFDPYYQSAQRRDQYAAVR